MARLPARPDHGSAWVTGASSGIGRALALELVRRGWRVGVTARREEQLQTLAAEAPEKFVVAPADVAHESQMRAAAETVCGAFGPIGLVVVCAGIYLPVSAEAPDIGAFRNTWDVNLMGAVHAWALAAPDMTARRQGHIHLVSSATGFGGMPTASAYGASKAALINMAECLNIELKRYGVGVSVSTPGFVKTPAQAETPFPKPFMVSPEFAARRIVDGLQRGNFEITFPRRFTWGLKALYALPRAAYLPLVRKQTGWEKPPKIIN
ncbi:MAG: SDR family NAD(P)-dependent oxidoreductase [Caulobacterales bacterium]